MNDWFISDTHFGHANIIKYSKRPFSDVKEMNEVLIKNWNDAVAPDDNVWHLGDFAFMEFFEFKKLLLKLNGNINVILGNHDKVITKNIKELLYQGKIISIQHYKELRIDSNLIVLFHYGLRTWNRAHYGSIHLFGHSHNSLPPFGLSVDVGVDSKEITSEYRPVSLNEVLEYMKKRKVEIIDHHGMQDD